LSIIDKTIEYIYSSLGITCQFDTLVLSNLPFYLKDNYRFYQIRLLGLSCLLMWARESNISPANIEKHCQVIRNLWPEGEVVYLAEAMTSQNRGRLIQYKVSFIVPGNQMYLPLLGIDLREHFRKSRGGNKAEVTLTPTAQLVVLWTLLKESVQGINSAQMAERLNCTRVAVARAYDELAGFEWAFVEKSRGNQKILVIESKGRSLWQLVSEHMQNPVRKVRWVLDKHDVLPAVLAGESALAKYTLMSEPQYPVYAIAANEWKGIQKSFQLKELTYPEPGCFTLQTWRYDPDLFAEDHCVDRLSLFLSFERESDPRIRMAADQLLEQIPW